MRAGGREGGRAVGGQRISDAPLRTFTVNKHGVWVCVRGLVPTENKSNTKATFGVKMPDKIVYRKTYMLKDVSCMLM